MRWKKAGLYAGFFVLPWVATFANAEEPTKPTASASETNPAVPAAGHSVHGEAFDEGPRHAAYLMPGMGKINFPVTTTKPEAQSFINQGVAQLHSFFYFEAERSFRQAAQIDPECAMAYWGMAMSNVGNNKRARGFLKDARKREGAVTKREKLYIDALEKRHEEAGSDNSRKQAHILGLETVVQEFPGDIDARAWLALATWDGGNPVSRQIIDIAIDAVMQVEPMHPGSHHYRIHLWDGGKQSRAEKSAAVYGRCAPGIAHAWHMPGHIYTGLQKYADAAYQQEASARVDHAYMIRDRVMPFEIHNYSHNNQWLATSLSHSGRVRDALSVARNLVEQPRDPDKNGKNDGGSSQRSGRLRWAEILTRYELWDDLIAATTSNALDWSDIPIERKERAYSLGLAYAAKGDQAKLDEQLVALKTLASDDAKVKRGNSVEAAIAELEGYQLLSKSEYAAAFERFAKAATMRPEALARAHLRARNYGLAESAAKSAVEKQANQIPPLAQCVEVLQLVGKTKEAREAYAKLVPLAKSADSDTPIFQRLALIVSAWKAEQGWIPPSGETPTDDLTANRADPASLGPLAWSPLPAEPFSRLDTAGKTWALAEHKGRNVIVVFFLGGKCAHCMQQLELFGKEADALSKLNTDIVAVSTDDESSTRQLKENKDGVKFPMPILSDPKFEVFKSYRAYDDFEGVPLHGTFLIDASGDVRFQRISADPFLDVEFIKTEAARIDAILARGKEKPRG